jgi:hypothetical protein
MAPIAQLYKDLNELEQARISEAQRELDRAVFTDPKFPACECCNTIDAPVRRYCDAWLCDDCAVSGR